jgi:hypothetical protein
MLFTNSSMVGNRFFASNTTITKQINNKPKLVNASFLEGGVACNLSSVFASAGKKISLWRTVCTATKAPYSISNTTTTKISWPLL